MEKSLYLILVSYFIIGALITFRINKQKVIRERKHNWIKYSTYLVIVNVLFAAAIFKTNFFPIIGIAVIVVGYGEILRLMIITRKLVTGFTALLAFTAGFYFFSRFTRMDSNQLVFGVVVVTVFDAISQLAGQLFGKRRIVPSVSPNKTLEGLLGGIFFAVFTALVVHQWVEIGFIQSAALGLGVATFAFFGDLTASFFKRKFDVKDYSNLIPGHGGFLDRFDSLIFGGAFLYLALNF